jgi:glycosyltransferase involved in cell wall biosynthesis
MSASAGAARSQVALQDRETLFERGTLTDAEASVCITLYDYEAYVLDALESARAQTLSALGLVVLDDASSDGGPALVESWMSANAGRFAGVCLARHRTNAGLACARNGAIDLTPSAYVMVLDADNMLYPRCVERMLASLRDASHGFAYSIIEKVGEPPGLMGTASWSAELLRRGNHVDAMALLRKSTWQAVGGYAPMAVGGWEDFDFWCKCVEADIEGLLVPEILCRYRSHESSMIKTLTERGRNSRRVRREISERHPWLRLPAD